MTADEIATAGPLALEIHRDEERVESIRLRWAMDGEKPDVATPLGLELQASLERYVSGDEPGWPELPGILDGLTGFRRSVLEELRRIPAGETLTYGQLAARCGSPGASRAVGRVMATNPWPLVYPCHRVLAAGGGIGGFGPGVEMKKWLLELEGAL